ncbi:MAG: radical SAM protein, partial [Nanoarchaeota archaeon]
MFDEIRQFLEEKGLPAMRFKQIEDAVFKGLILNFGDMQYLPKDLREELCEKFVLNPFEIVEVEDSSESSKFVFKTQDGNYIESVLMRHLKDRRTVCVSSQIFCAMGCKFCATGANKFKRNLTEEEIVFQVLSIGKYLKDKSEVPVKNVVFMGMGEPFMNYNNVLGAIRVFNDDKKMGIGARHITVSTCGLADKIEKFADEGLQVRLAISFHAPFADLR